MPSATAQRRFDPLATEAEFWRGWAQSQEAAGDIVGTVLFWQAAIAATRRCAAARGIEPDLGWLQQRLQRATAIADFSTGDRPRGICN